MVNTIEDIAEDAVKGKITNGNATFADMDCSWWDPENKEADGRYFTLQWMFDSVKSQLPAGQGRLALDVGAGRGRYTKLLHDKGYGVVSTDINPDMLDIIAKRGIPSRMYLADAENLPFESKNFDIISD